MSTTPNLLFKKALGIENLIGGVIFPRYTGTWGKFGNVISLDCTSLTIANNSEANCLRLDAYKFSNGGKLVAKLWVKDSQSNHVNARLVAVNPLGVERALVDDIDMDNSFYPTLTLVHTFGIKIYLMTRYLSTQEGTSESLEFDLYFSVPHVAVNGDYILSCYNIGSGKELMFEPNWNDRPSVEAFLSSLGMGDGLTDQTAGAYIFIERYATFTNADSFLNTYFGLPNGSWTSDDADKPVQENDPSSPGGGGGGYDGYSDPIDFPILPTGGALGSGSCKAYCPTGLELKSLFEKLWNTAMFDISTFQKLVDNPIDCIISLHAIPVSPELTTRTSEVYIGNFNTEIGMDTIGSQYLTVDCGSVDVKEFWGSALDYNPYTKCSIFLPFVGIKDLNVDDVMKKNIRVKYNIDVISGECLAMVKCGTAVLYKFNGIMKQDIPVTGQSSEFPLKNLQATLSAVGSLAMGTAIGGPVGAATALAGGLSSASTIAGSKMLTNRSGSLTGNVGILDDYVPYLILHRPVQSLAENFNKYKGYPSNITAVLSTLSGYTEVEFIHLRNIPNATSAEISEIKSLLQAGVII